MTTKKFEIFPQNVAKDGTLIIIQKGLKLYNISDVVDLLNTLHEENQELRKDVIYWRHKALNEEPVNCRCEVKYND